MSSPALPVVDAPRTLAPAIAVDGLTRSYRSGTCIGPLTFEIPGGRITGLVGPNGVGKTTTIRMLLGLIRPDEGQMRVLEAQSWSQLHSVLDRVGALVDGPALVPTLTGRKNLLMLSRLSGWPDARVNAALAVVGLAERADRPVREYSLGMRQRLALAGALLGDPDLLILDEPANGLDPQGISELRELLARIAASGTTIVVSSHVLAEVEQVCEHLVVLSDAGVAFHGPREELTARLKGRLLIETAAPDDFPRMRALCEQLGFSVQVQAGDVLSVEAAGEPGSGDSPVVDGPALDGGQLNAQAAAAGIVLSRLEPRRQSLEDIFFELTGDPGSTGDRLGLQAYESVANTRNSS